MLFLRPLPMRPLFALLSALFVCGSAFAQQTSGGGDGGILGSVLPLIFIVVIFYFLMIRPQQKRVKAHRTMLEALSIGDEVLTSGGLFGKVTKITDNIVVLEVDKIQMPFQKQSIQSLLPAGSLEKL